MANYTVAIQRLSISSTDQFVSVANSSLTAPAGFAILDRIVDMEAVALQGPRPGVQTGYFNVRAIWRDA